MRSPFSLLILVICVSFLYLNQAGEMFINGIDDALSGLFVLLVFSLFSVFGIICLCSDVSYSISSADSESNLLLVFYFRVETKVLNSRPCLFPR